MSINSAENTTSLVAYSEETLGYLFEKLDFIRLNPRHLLLIGHAALADQMRSALKQRYPEAICDFLSERIRDYPLKSNHYELILCHCLDPRTLLPEDLAENVVTTHELLFYLLQYFLKPGGLLLFSQIGPDSTLENLNSPEMPIQALGDVLLKLEYQDPVLDRDRFMYDEGYLTLAYGHAWKKTEENLYFSKPDENGSVFMPISEIQHLETAN